MSDLPPSRRQPAPRVTDLSTISDLFVVIQYLDLRVDGEFTTKTLQPHLGTKLVGTAGFPFVDMKSATERLDAIAKRSNILTRIGDGHWKLATMPAEWQAKLDDAAEASPSRTITTPRAAAAIGGMTMTTLASAIATPSAAAVAAIAEPALAPAPSAPPPKEAAAEAAETQAATDELPVGADESVGKLRDQRISWLHEQFGDGWFTTGRVMQIVYAGTRHPFANRRAWSNFAVRTSDPRFHKEVGIDGYHRYQIVVAALQASATAPSPTDVAKAPKRIVEKEQPPAAAKPKPEQKVGPAVKRRLNWLRQQFGDNWFLTKDVMPRAEADPNSPIKRLSDWGNTLSPAVKQKLFDVDDTDQYIRKYKLKPGVGKYEVAAEMPWPEHEQVQPPAAVAPVTASPMPPPPPPEPTPAPEPAPAPTPDQATTDRIAALENRVAELEEVVETLAAQIARFTALRTALQAFIAFDHDEV